MAQRFGTKHKIFFVVAFILLVLVSGALIAFFSPPTESRLLKDPTLVATQPPVSPMVFAPNTGSSMRKRFYEIYYEVSPPKRGNYSFSGRAAPVLCSIQGLLNQCHEVSGVQFFIDKQVASGSVMFGPTNTLNGPQWVAAFTNAVQKGEVTWWVPSEQGFRKENPVFIAVDEHTCLVLPKDRVNQYVKGR